MFFNGGRVIGRSVDGMRGFVEEAVGENGSILDCECGTYGKRNMSVERG